MRLSYPSFAFAVSVAAAAVSSPLALAQPEQAHADFHTPAAFSWDNAIVYPIITDRFANGEPANDRAYGRPYRAIGTPSGAAAVGGSDPTAAHHFQGGDFRGIVDRITDGYFANLGISVVRISPPFEQTHGFADTEEGSTYAFQGGWPIDFTEIDSAWGGSAGLRELLDAARASGIRVLVDINLNSAGPPTDVDTRRFGFGPSIGDPPTTDSAVDSAWAMWWGPGWVRADLPGYPRCGDEDVTACKDGLPDFRTEIGEPAEVPAFLLNKWGPEKAKGEQRELDAWFAQTKHPRTPRHYLVKWMADWVREYGVDGFFALDADLVDVGLWSSLKSEAEQALADWRMSRGVATRGATAFWLAGDAEPESPLADELFARGFNALPVWLDAPLLAADALDSLYAARSAALTADASRRFTAHLNVGDAEDDEQLMTAYLLIPGAVALPFGLEFGGQVTAPAMLSETGEGSVPSWAEVARFRSRHPAVGAGTHQLISAGPYTFQRTYRGANVVDNVVVVLGAEGRTRINVSGAFPDDAIVRDAITGSTGFVSFGYVSFTPDESGTLLLELAVQQ